MTSTCQFMWCTMWCSTLWHRRCMENLAVTVLIQALLGGGASVVLEGQRVVPSRTQDAGFRFQYSHVNQAIANIFR